MMMCRMYITTGMLPRKTRKNKNHMIPYMYVKLRQHFFVCMHKFLQIKKISGKNLAFRFGIKLTVLNDTAHPDLKYVPYFKSGCIFCAKMPTYRFSL